MAIQYVDQISTLSVFAGVDMETGEPLPVEKWSDKVWATEFAEALRLNGLRLSWTDCTVYCHRAAYAIPAGSYTFVTDPTYATSVVVWLDPTSPDNLTVDLVLMDGARCFPDAPVVAGDVVRLAWGTIEAGAADMELNVLRHKEEI